MKFAYVLPVLAAQSALGFPQYKNTEGLSVPQVQSDILPREGLHSVVEQRSKLETRQERERGFLGNLFRGLGDITGDLLGGVTDLVGDVVGGTVSGLVSVVDGLLGSVAGAVDPNDLRPEPGFEFQEPGPNDSRGPCPGLNLLANHGYLPRNGHVTFDEVLTATARGFNMGADLATVLCVFAILANGDIETQSFFLGSGPGGVGGLNRHSTVESDISPNREDFFLGCGDNHHLSSRLFRQMVNFAAEGSGEFDYPTMRRQYAANAEFSQENNPFLYFFPFPSIVSVAAYNFIPEFFSNGTFGRGGVANYESIAPIFGARLDPNTGEYEYVPERFPPNWYRRSRPYGAVEALLDGFTRIYPARPIPMLVAQLGTENLETTTLLCNIFQGLNSIVPLSLGGSFGAITGGVTWAVNRLIDVGLDDTNLGCPSEVISPNFLFPEEESEGGPLNPPADVAANTGDNVYGRVYFPFEPTEPVCESALDLPEVDD